MTSARVARNRPSETFETLVNQTKTYWPWTAAPSLVSVIVPDLPDDVPTCVAPSRLRALYFTRAAAPSGDGPLYHHIGLYAFRRAALQRFVALPPSPLEQREKLEQLRALEAGMRIDVAIIDSVPIGVNTPEDLARARAVLSGRS